jgi:hypothetical protein
MSLLSLKTIAGTSLTIDVDSIAGSGSEKTGFFTPERDQVALFFHRGLTDRAARLERLNLILNRFNITKGQNQEKWRERFCWPTAIIDRDCGLPAEFAREHGLHPEILGLIVPAYPAHFFFYDVTGRLRAKEGRWFTGLKSRQLVPTEERGSLGGFLYCALSLTQSLSRMHFSGLAHSDLSARNVLIDPSSGQSYVTDVDSLVVPNLAPPLVVGSPGYVAPEVVAGKSTPSIKSDLHSLAVLIYEMLLLRHPLAGSKVHSESPEECEKLGMGEGALFVEHPKDRSNQLLPPPLLSFRTLGPHLAPLIQRAFVDGLHRPQARPTAAEWETAIVRTIDLLHPTLEGDQWLLLAPDWPDLDSRAGRISWEIPYARLHRPHPHSVGEFVAESAPGHFCIVYHGLRLNRHHFFCNVSIDEEAGAGSTLGYFAKQGNDWYLVNESDGPIFVDGNRPVESGEATAHVGQTECATADLRLSQRHQEFAGGMNFLRSNKWLLFATLGFLGGALGAIPGFLIHVLGEVISENVSGILGPMLKTALWMAWCSASITLALFWAGEIYHRRPIFRTKVILQAIALGVAGGAVAGFCAQFVYSIPLGYFLKNYVLRSLCWGIAGGLLGVAISRVIPNLGYKKGAIGGLVGGMIGGLAFILTAEAAGTLIVGHSVGLGLIGLALGLCLVSVEAIFREAAMQVIWAPNETTIVSLGPRMVTIGGGDDSIYIPSLPQRAAGITFVDGKLTYTDLQTNQTKPMRDGSRMKIGRVEIVVMARP